MGIKDKLKEKLSDFVRFCKRCNCCCRPEPEIEIVHMTHQQALAKPTPYFNLRSSKKYNKFDDTINNPIYHNVWDTDDITDNKDNEKSNLNDLSDTNPFKYGANDVFDDEEDDVIYFNENYFGQ